ncbi:uncharacterized protein LOC135197749 [Macrobrachium nipponense]|uniref:uncharacterized protein LOC135197749 n=1 Tax=Macrobrachium nipponense TaxID=159736 RepID=UPI0030C86B74
MALHQFLACMPRRNARRCGYILVIWCLLCYLLISFSTHSESIYGNSPQVIQQVLDLRSQESKSVMGFNLLKSNPSIDRSPKLSEPEMAAKIQKKEPNLPIEFWQKSKHKQLSMNSSCAKMPSLYDIHFNNKYWQSLETSNGSFYLFAAYYDNRTLAERRPLIRILGMIDKLDPTVKPYCQMWFDGMNKPVFSQVWQYKWIWVKEWGNYRNGVLQPYLMSCQVPSQYQNLVPESVSLAEKPCDMATTHLRVINDRPPSGEKEDFAVCVKGINYPFNDLSVRLTEWLELLFLLGANKVFMYDMEVHPNISKILSYYQDKGQIGITKLTLPGWQPNVRGFSYMYLKAKLVHKRQNEVIPYNDCFYKNMYKYKYIALLDIDEVIMPRNSSSWKELLEIVKQNDQGKNRNMRSSYVAQNIYFMDSMHKPEEPDVTDVPSYMHMLKNVYRSGNYTLPGAYVKCFHDTERILTLHNHFPFSCIGPQCSAYPMNTHDAHLQHYRSDCVGELKKVCGVRYKSHPTKDPSILKYKQALVSRVADTLKRLDFFKNETVIKSDNTSISR